jgi:hypothetical protein
MTRAIISASLIVVMSYDVFGQATQRVLSASAACGASPSRRAVSALADKTG